MKAIAFFGVLNLTALGKKGAAKFIMPIIKEVKKSSCRWFK